MHIGIRIKLLRKNKALTLKDLSEGIISIPYLSNIEAKKFEPSKEILEKLAKRLEVPVEYLVNYNVSTDQSREEITQLYLKCIEDFSKAKSIFEEISKDRYRYPSIYQEVLYKLAYTIFLFKTGEYDKAKELHDNYLEHYINESNYKEFPTDGQIAYTYYLGISNYYKKKLNTSLKYFVKLAYILPDAVTIKANVLYNMAVILCGLRRFNESLNQAKKSLQLHYENHNWVKVGELHNFIGVVYWELGDLEDANKSLEKSLEIADLKEFKGLKKRILHNKGLIAQKENKYLDAIQYYYASISYGKEVDDSDLLLSYLAIIDCYLILEEIDKAENVLKTATSSVRSPYDHHRLSLKHAEFLLKKGQDNEYIKRLEAAIRYFEKIEDRIELVGLYQRAGDYYFQDRKYKDAAKYYQNEIINKKELEE